MASASDNPSVAAEQPGTSNVRPHARKLQIARDANFDVQADRDLYKAGETVNLVVPRMLTQDPQAKPKATSGPMNADVFVDGQKLPLLNAFPANTTQGHAQGSPPPGAFQYGQSFGGGFGGGGNRQRAGISVGGAPCRAVASIFRRSLLLRVSQLRVLTEVPPHGLRVRVVFGRRGAGRARPQVGKRWPGSD